MASDDPGAGTLADAGFDDLLREVLLRVQGVVDDQARWQLLLDAVVTMAADRSLDELLARIVEVASDLAGARYAALGVLAVGPGKRLSTFITHGLTREEEVAIGELPAGHGLLGHIIDHPEAVRLDDLGKHRSSHGFPAHHPPMSAFLGVPIRIRDQVFGNLYLTEKVGGGAFSDQDEKIVTALAAAAGVAIENARLQEQAARREAWLAATAEISADLLGSMPDDPWRVVVDRARSVAGADLAWVLSGSEPDQLELRAVSGSTGGADPQDGLHLCRELAAEVVRTGVQQRVDQLGADVRADPARSAAPDWVPDNAVTAVLVVPLQSGAGVLGALALGWAASRVEEFHLVDPALPTAFAERATLALQVARSRASEQRLAVFEDRDRIGRDLHDLVIQRLFAIGLGLQSVARQTDKPEVATRLETAVDDLDATIRDIRRSIFALGAMDDAADVQSEVSRIVDRAAGTLKFRPALRFEGPVRSAVSSAVAPELLAVLGEALSNAARHAEASTVDVVVAADDGELRLSVADNGRGMPQDAHESGLTNMRARADRLGGRCTVESTPGRGTTVVWVVPLA